MRQHRFFVFSILLAGCSAPIAVDPIFEIRRAEFAPSAGFQRARSIDRIKGEETVFVFAEPEILSKHVLRAEIEDETKVRIQFTPEGTMMLQKISKAHVKKPLAVFFFGKIVSLPLVHDELPGPTGVLLTGHYSKVSAKILCEVLSKK